MSDPRNLPEPAREAVRTAFWRGASATQWTTWLADGEPRVRALAVRGVARDADVAHDLWTSCQHDTDPGVRREVWLAAATHHVEIDPHEALSDDDALVREAAVFFAGETRRASARTALEGMALSDEDARVREAAVVALGQIGDDVSIPTLLTVLATDKAPVRRRVIVALSAFDDPRVEAALDAASEDRDWQTRDAVTRLRRSDF